MGIASKLIGEGLSSPISAIGKIIDNVYTSDDEKLDKHLLMQRLLQEPAMVQAEVNKIEAQHRTVFVAGWRPFIGWVCGTALAYSFIVRDLIAWGIRIAGSDVEPPPELAMEHLITVLMGILGLGTMRTVEKLGGRTK